MSADRSARHGLTAADAVAEQPATELRTQLRAVHRALRDHFTQINDQRLRTAVDAVRAATDTASVNGQRDARLSVPQRQTTDKDSSAAPYAAPEGSLGLDRRGLSVLGVELDSQMAEMARGCRKPGHPGEALVIWLCRMCT